MLIIKELAKQKGLSLEDIADKLGVSRVTVSRNINGNPTVKTLEAIAQVLDVDIKDLFQDNDQLTETLYVKRDGQFSPIGKISRESKENE